MAILTPHEIYLSRFYFGRPSKLPIKTRQYYSFFGHVTYNSNKFFLLQNVVLIFQICTANFNC